MPARLREMTAGCCHSNHTCPGYVVSVSKECSRTFQGFPGPILASAAAHHGFQTPNAANLSFFFPVLSFFFLPQLHFCPAVKPLDGIQPSLSHLWAPQWANCPTMRVQLRIGSSRTPVRSSPVTGYTEPSATGSWCERSRI